MSSHTQNDLVINVVNSGLSRQYVKTACRPTALVDQWE